MFSGMKKLSDLKLRHIFDIKPSTDYERTEQGIQEGISIRGFNMWMLLCAVVLASIGLDTNSPAVIIGAMLISPLMGPILGIGFNVATQNKAELIRSLYNFGIATALSLLAALLYFSLSPLAEVTEQLELRVQPTFLDVLIALFGGLAGIIAQSRKGIVNAIPGVAIATALMPPLCTAGFGLGTGRWEFFAGAMYLFLINTFFISFAAFLIIRLLGFPQQHYVSERVRRRVTIWIGLFSLLFVAPSVYFLVRSIQYNRYQKAVNNFVQTQINIRKHPVIEHKLVKGDTNLCQIYTFGQGIGPDEQQQLQKKLDSLHLFPTRLEFVHSYSLEGSQDLNQVLEGHQQKQAQWAELNQSLLQLADSLEAVLLDTASFGQMQAEIKAAFPEIEQLTFARQAINSQRTTAIMPLCVAYFAARTAPMERKKLAEKLENYLKLRLGVPELILIPV